MRLGVRAALVEGQLVEGDVEVRDGFVSAAGCAPAGRGGVAIPGLVDIHINGFAAVDFLACGPEGYDVAGPALAAAGVTAYQPTFITAPVERLVAAVGVVGEAIERGALGARVIGAHVEGPFLAAAYRGIHPASALRDPDPAVLRALLDAGPVTTYTLAPELPGALELVSLLRERGVAVSCGHTGATFGQAVAAFDAGAGAVTHLFNAMRPLHHREPGIVAAALLRDDVVVQLIADGYHVADEAVALAWRAARGRLSLVTDAIAAAGLGDGDYPVGPVEVQVRGGEARLPDGTIAGSVGMLLDGVRRLHRLGASFEDAVAAATSVPARFVGRPDLGVLRVGGVADIAVLDDRLELVQVLVGGEPALG